MRRIRPLVLGLVMGLLPAAHAAEPVLIVHGGAGVVRSQMSAADEAAVRAALETALKRGHAELAAGKSALDAVTAAIVVLEDNPHFNAGRGAVFTHEGRNELDASIMDGKTRAAGAVAGVQRIKNPITLARAVMERSEHVMLVGKGAETFAREHGFKWVKPDYFRTERRWNQLQQRLRGDTGPVADAEYLKYVGTVGAVALDATGGLAAGTSTGGMTDKRWNRVGDSPVIGAGTWADARCAVSSTGWGEYYIRTAAAHSICARVALRSDTAASAGAAVINEEIVAMGGDGGAIVMTADGDFAFPFNTEGMYRGWIGADGVPHIALYAGEGLRGDVVPAAPGGAEAPPH
ncbi:isoaspartyl peptidase/L-asparaginase family protein [Luteimonas sp. e5]